MKIKLGPAGLGPVKTAEKTLEDYAKKGFKACEIAFTYSVYIKNESDAVRIGKKARDLGISLSIHAPYFVNLNSTEKSKRDATKQRILNCCKVGEWLGAKRVVFHPGYYTKNKSSLSRKLPKLASARNSEEKVSDGKYDKENSYNTIKNGIIDIMKYIKKNNWKIKICPETMGKVNVFGSVEEISKLVRDTGCDFCVDFAHILAREKSVDYEKVKKLFPQKEWHVHFSGIVYGEKGERKHKTTEKKEWNELFENLKKIANDNDFVIINESPTMIEDCIEGIELEKNIK